MSDRGHLTLDTEAWIENGNWRVKIQGPAWVTDAIVSGIHAGKNFVLAGFGGAPDTGRGSVLLVVQSPACTAIGGAEPEEADPLRRARMGEAEG